MAETAPSREALLADAARALRQVRPERADAILQELEYATGRDPRPVVARTGGFTGTTRPEELLAAVLAAANDVEARLPHGWRVRWRAYLEPVADTTVQVLGVEAEPVEDFARAGALAAAFLAAFPIEVDRVRDGGPADMPSWFFPRLLRLGTGRPRELVLAHVTDVLAGAGALALPPAPARFRVVPEVAPALRECFPERAEAILDRLWDALVAPVPRAAAVRHDGGAPGRTPREIALQVVDLMNAIEREQPEGARARWSAAPAPAAAVEIRGVAG